MSWMFQMPHREGVCMRVWEYLNAMSGIEATISKCCSYNRCPEPSLIGFCLSLSADRRRAFATWGVCPDLPSLRVICHLLILIISTLMLTSPTVEEAPPLSITSTTPSHPHQLIELMWYACLTCSQLNPLHFILFGPAPDLTLISVYAANWTRLNCTDKTAFPAATESTPDVSTKGKARQTKRQRVSIPVISTLLCIVTSMQL